jgi:hypothetical protein
MRVDSFSLFMGVVILSTLLTKSIFGSVNKHLLDVWYARVGDALCPTMGCCHDLILHVNIGTSYPHKYISSHENNYLIFILYGKTNGTIS